MGVDGAEDVGAGTVGGGAATVGVAAWRITSQAVACVA